MKTTLWFASTALALAAAGGLAKAFPLDGTPPPSLYPAWEYRLEPKAGTRMDIPERNDHQYRKLIDDLGKEGWEYAGDFGQTEFAAKLQFAIVFKRLKR